MALSLFPPHRPMTNEMCLPVQRPYVDSSEHCLSLSKSFPYSRAARLLLAVGICPPSGSCHTLLFVQRSALLDSAGRSSKWFWKQFLGFWSVPFFGKTKQSLANITQFSTATFIYLQKTSNTLPKEFPTVSFRRYRLPMLKPTHHQSKMISVTSWEAFLWLQGKQKKCCKKRSAK